MSVNERPGTEEGWQDAEKRRKRMLNNLLVNNLLLLSAFVMVISGLTLQLGFHAGGPGGHQFEVHGAHSRTMKYEEARGIDTNKIVYGFTYPVWSNVHRLTIILFSLLIMYHVYAHWRWYKGVVARRQIHKNFQTLTLSMLFLAVAVTGFVPWFIDLSGSTVILRTLLIEIHDKLAFVLIVFFILHVAKRAKWYITAHRKYGSLRPPASELKR
jgi:magnesium-transporting ATPase (P-type)